MDYDSTNAIKQKYASNLARNTQAKKVLSCLLSKLQSHSSIYGFKQNYEGLLIQLGLQTQFLNPSTIAHYTRSLRVLLCKALELRTCLVEDGTEGSFGDILPACYHKFPWFTNLNWNEVEELYEQVVQLNTRSLIKFGKQWEDSVIKGVRTSYPKLSKEQALFLASGIKQSYVSENHRKSPKKDWITITPERFQEILESIEPGTPMEGFLSLSKKEKNYPGLFRLIVPAIWLTGMRPIETFCCQVIDRRTSKEFLETYGVVDKSFQLKRTAGNGGRLIDNGLDSFIKKGNSFDYPKELRQYLTLQIPSAKTRNSSSSINAIRLMNLEGISHEDLQIILLTSCVRKFLLNKREFYTCCKGLNTLFREAAIKVFPDRKPRLTLYYLRHTFLNDARRSMPIAEAGTLAGHTSKQTLYQYGAPYVRYSKHAKTRSWFPKPDQIAVQQLERHWADKSIQR